MRFHRAAIVGMGVLGAAIAASRLMVDHAPSAQVRVAETHQPAEDALAALQREVDVLKQRFARTPTVATFPRDERVEHTMNASSSETASKPTRVSYRPAEIAEMLDAHYASDRGDRGWSDELQGELSTAFGARSGTVVSSVQCATSLCKVSLLHETGDAQRGLGASVASLPGLAAGVFYHYEDGAEPPRTVLYVVRKGHTIQEMLAVR